MDTVFVKTLETTPQNNNNISKLEVLEHENQLLRNRNQILAAQNNQLLRKMEQMAARLDYYATQKLPITTHNNSTSSQSSSRLSRPEYEELVTLRLQKQQVLDLCRERGQTLFEQLEESDIENKTINKIKDKLALMDDLNLSGSYTGMIKVLFELCQNSAQAYLEAQTAYSKVKQKEIELRLDTRRRVLSDHNNNNKPEPIRIMVRDPEYVASQTEWISRFEEEYCIMKGFYEKVINALLRKEQMRSVRAASQEIMLQYGRMQLKKLEMYRLALRIQNEEREFEVRMGKGSNLDGLRVSINNMVESLQQQEQELGRIKQQIAHHFNKL